MLTPEHKAKIRWNCRRGMLELDLILERFVNNHLDSLNARQLKEFEILLNATDPDLYAFLMGSVKPTDSGCVEIVDFIRLHNKL